MITLSVVVLPAPLVPSKPNTEFLGTENVKLLTACFFLFEQGALKTTFKS